MSDPNPKVAVKQNTAGRWIAFCREDNCTWVQEPTEKTYANQRAKAHRRDHRESVCSHCERSDHCERCGGCLAPHCQELDCLWACRCGEDRM